MIEKLKKVLELCYEISTTTDTDVFFGYSPHCGIYDVDYCLGGWEKNKKTVYIANGHYITDANLDRTIAALEELKEMSFACMCEGDKERCDFEKVGGK